MMRAMGDCGLAAVLLATMSLPTPAGADDNVAPVRPLLFQTFERLCIATDGDPVAAEATAKSIGFAVDPTVSASGSGAAPLVWAPRDGERFLFAAREVTDAAAVPPSRTANCLVMGPDPGGESAAAVADWAGMPGETGEEIEGHAVTRYHFEEKDGARLPIPAAESAEAAASRLAGAGETGVHVVAMGDGMTTLHQFRVRLARTTPAPPKADQP